MTRCALAQAIDAGLTYNTSSTLGCHVTIGLSAFGWGGTPS